jgi:hypothetical protein
MGEWIPIAVAVEDISRGTRLANELEGRSIHRRSSIEVCRVYFLSAHAADRSGPIYLCARPGRRFLSTRYL